MKNQPEAISAHVQGDRPIFILGISQRSGTNFLFDLLLQHPDCWSSPVKINEDFFIYHSDILCEFSHKVVNRWKSWIEKDGFEGSLCKSLGDGLLSFLTAEQRGKRFITKTPSVRNVDRFFNFFPNAYLIILVRDGRAVVESRVKTFGESYEKAIRTWAEAADTILRNEQVLKKSQFKCLIVKYEDLCQDIEREMGRVLKFLDLDCKIYDFESARNLPVRGSSVYRGQGMSKIHWQPVEKTPDFNPLERWGEWNRLRHEQFNCLAGKYLKLLGYEEKRYNANRLLWALGIRALLFQWSLKHFLGRKLSSLKRVVKAILGEERIIKIRSLFSISHEGLHAKSK